MKKLFILLLITMIAFAVGCENGVSPEPTIEDYAYEVHKGFVIDTLGIDSTAQFSSRQETRVTEIPGLSNHFLVDGYFTISIDTTKYTCEMEWIGGDLSKPSNWRLSRIVILQVGLPPKP